MKLRAHPDVATRERVSVSGIEAAIARAGGSRGRSLLIAMLAFTSPHTEPPQEQAPSKQMPTTNTLDSDEPLYPFPTSLTSTGCVGERERTLHRARIPRWDRQPIMVCLLFFAKVFLFKWPHTEYVNATQELHHHRHSQMLKPCLPLDIPNQRIPLGDLIEDNNGGASINIRLHGNYARLGYRRRLCSNVATAPNYIYARISISTEYLLHYHHHPGSTRLCDVRRSTDKIKERVSSYTRSEEPETFFLFLYSNSI